MMLSKKEISELPKDSKRYQLQPKAIENDAQPEVLDDKLLRQTIPLMTHIQMR